MALLLLAGKEAKEQSGCAYNNIKNGVSWSLAKRLIKLVKRIWDAEKALSLL